MIFNPTSRPQNFCLTSPSPWEVQSLVVGVAVVNFPSSLPWGSLSDLQSHLQSHDSPRGRSPLLQSFEPSDLQGQAWASMGQAWQELQSDLLEPEWLRNTGVQNFLENLPRALNLPHLLTFEISW